jgi:hypothetical protein
MAMSMEETIMLQANGKIKRKQNFVSLLSQPPKNKQAKRIFKQLSNMGFYWLDESPPNQTVGLLLKV